MIKIKRINNVVVTTIKEEVIKPEVQVEEKPKTKKRSKKKDV